MPKHEQFQLGMPFGSFLIPASLLRCFNLKPLPYQPWARHRSEPQAEEHALLPRLCRHRGAVRLAGGFQETHANGKGYAGWYGYEYKHIYTYTYNIFVYIYLSFIARFQNWLYTPLTPSIPQRNIFPGQTLSEWFGVPFGEPGEPGARPGEPRERQLARGGAPGDPRGRLPRGERQARGAAAPGGERLPGDPKPETASGAFSDSFWGEIMCFFLFFSVLCLCLCESFFSSGKLVPILSLLLVPFSHIFQVFSVSRESNRKMRDRFLGHLVMGNDFRSWPMGHPTAFCSVKNALPV